ncbi:hypothetical protein GCM10023196_037300 [Actinoallomurus vinaceus]|uniref:Uncharacterized protein n=1 Tax=Actinoallomurus vinaceus TaxID=1080074 RepID=A0ABP8U9C3_9ACTN
MANDWNSDHTATGECLKEADGYHAHVYRAWGSDVDGRMRRLRVELHMHDWMPEHRKLYPDTRDVDAHTPSHAPLGRWDTVEQAWKELRVEGDIPEVSC